MVVTPPLASGCGATRQQMWSGQKLETLPVQPFNKMATKETSLPLYADVKIVSKKQQLLKSSVGPSRKVTRGLISSLCRSTARL